MENKKVLVLVIGLGVLLLTLSFLSGYLIKKPNLNSEVGNNDKNILSSEPQTLFDIVSITEEEYLSKREENYREINNFPESDRIPEKVSRNNTCWEFIDGNGRKSDLTLCDVIPKGDELESLIQKYQTPILVNEIGGYFISRRLYEGANLYLLNYKYPFRLVPTYGYPIISPDSKYFFTVGNDAGGYGETHGIEVWRIHEDKYFSKIVTLSPEYFIKRSITEAFWFNKDIYIKTDSYAGGLETSGYMKISFLE